MSPAVRIEGLDYRYDAATPVVLHAVSVEIARGARALLVGRNGAGKSTLLEILAGLRLVPPEAVQVLGRPAFHDTSLSGRVSFIGTDFPFEADVSAGAVIEAQKGIDPVRRDALVRMLGIDLEWRMSRVSTGQRRRVQIALGLLRPVELLLLDEVLSDLDLVARLDLLSFLREETARAGASIVLATHVFDRLDDWATELVQLAAGRVLRHEPAPAVLQRSGTLLDAVEGWLRTPGA